jgi:hypothetical protein
MPDSPDRTASSDYAAEAYIRIGERAHLEARVTTAGLLSVGVLVSAILLSTAVIVSAAGKHARRGKHRTVGDQLHSRDDNRLSHRKDAPGLDYHPRP